MNFKAQEKLFDIEWFEGPLMSLFTNKKDEVFIYKWVNVNPDSHTWLVFRTTPLLVNDYLQKVISERELILLAQESTWYLVDINPEIKYSNKRVLTASELHQSILPKSHTYFREDNCIEPEKLQRFISEESVNA